MVDKKSFFIHLRGYYPSHLRVSYLENLYDLQETLIDLVAETCTFLSDYNNHIYRADLAMPPYFAEFNPKNDIVVHTFTPEKETIGTKNGMRSAIRLGLVVSKIPMGAF